jgi:hypothetical protein
MKTLLAILISISFAFNAQASFNSDSELTAKMSSMLDEADKMKSSDLGFKKLVTINVLESLASSNIEDPELIKRVTDNVENLEQAFSNGQRAMVRRSLLKLSRR